VKLKLSASQEEVTIRGDPKDSLDELGGVSAGADTVASPDGDVTASSKMNGENLLS